MKVAGTILTLLIAGSIAARAGDHSSSSLTADAIIQKAVDCASSSHARANSPGYTYTKKNVTEEFDTRGKVKQRKERMFQVYFRAGTSYVKLLEVNGRAPAQADVKFQAETQSSLNQFFGGNSRETFMTPDIAARFDFTLIAQSSFNGRPTYQITFSPKNSALPVHRVMDRLLDHVSGTLWIDAEEFEVARADIQLGSEVDFLGGVIGCLRKLAYSMTRTRVAEGVWLHSVSAGDFEGRKLLEPMRIKMKSECSNFQLMAAAK